MYWLNKSFQDFRAWAKQFFHYCVSRSWQKHTHTSHTHIHIIIVSVLNLPSHLYLIWARGFYCHFTQGSPSILNAMGECHTMGHAIRGQTIICTVTKRYKFYRSIFSRLQQSRTYIKYCHISLLSCMLPCGICIQFSQRNYIFCFICKRSWHFVTLPTIIGGRVIFICWFVVYKLTFDICRHQAQLLTHWHLVIANGMIILDQHWLRSWLGAWWRQGGIFLFCIQLRTISKIFSGYQSITHMWISHTNNFIHIRQVSMS